MPRSKKIIIEPTKVDELMQDDESMPPMEVLIKVNGQELKGVGTTIEEAILKIEPIRFKTMAYVSVKNGNKKTEEMMFNIPRLKRLFFNEVFRRIMANQLLLRLK
jgi:hypothetical protein